MIRWTYLVKAASGVDIARATDTDHLYEDKEQLPVNL